jgi:glycosyltransferase involved in cell wall biosynthesis
MIDNGINGFVVQNLDEFAEKVVFFLQGNKLPPGAATHLRKKIDRQAIYADLLALFEACAARRSPNHQGSR